MEENEYFTIEGIKELEKMTTEGAKSASDALSKLIGQETSIRTVQVRVTPISKVSDFIADPDANVTAVRMDLSGDVFGNIMLIYPQNSAINIVNMIAKRPLGSKVKFNELHISILKESGNIIAGSFLSKISDYLDVNMIESIPTLETNTLKTVIDTSVKLFVDREVAESIAMEINFNISAGPEESDAEKILPEIGTQGYFIILLDVESASNISASLGKISVGK